ncbi:MliC family protein [Devosia sediminis]|uniref:MliC family protein n=1 Tax=Devosia sediminis TaxID=2798801 RepID=A0A934IWP8_9HYPH|nr:MliC family protein [Devosia sediminis]MBJ3783687.1 MliC family protein [Devosia sediminis]
MTPIRITAAVALLFATSTLAVAQTEEPAPPPAPTPPATSASLTLTLESTGNIEREIVNYQCDDEQVLSVQYLNAAPNFLAIVPVDGQNLVFATTISGSGARYVAGPYEWWSHQGEATLSDLTQDEDAPPRVTCTASSNTP